MKRRFSAVILLLLIVGLSVGGSLRGVDDALQDLRFSLAQRTPSGEIVMAQIDTTSLDTVGVWPWPRAIHAKLIDILREARVRDIALDIDFSHPSGSEVDDAALEAALKRAAGGVILPAFRQPAGSDNAGNITVVSQPLPRFAQYSWPAIVNVWPERDGIVRQLEYSSRLNGEIVPGMAMLLSGGNVVNDQRFGVDFSINPDEIPRLSVADILNGKIDTTQLAGKSVIIGATAIELGDRLAVPVHGVIAGPTLQALAAETLRQNRAITTPSSILAVFAFLIVLAGLGASVANLNWRRDFMLWPAISVIIELVANIVFQQAAISLATAPLHALILAYLCWRAYEEIDFRRVKAHFAMIERDNTEMLLGGVLHDSFDGVIIVNDLYYVITVNRTAQAVLQAEFSAGALTTLRDILPAAFAEPAQQAVQDAMSNASGIVKCELSVPLGDKPRYLELVTTRSLLRGNAQQRVITLTFRDITERRLAVDAIARAAEEAQAASRAKSSFLAAVSHELRTPLNAIIGFSDILKAEMFGKLGDERYGEYSTHISQSGRHLLSIVNDILDITRIEAGNLSLDDDEISVEALFDDLRRTAMALPGGNRRTLNVDIAPAGLKLLVDPTVFKQIMLNLVSNAVKFTKDDVGTIDLMAAVAPDGKIRIAVRDNGVGIDSEHLPNLTKPFYQVDGRLAREHEGAGLGLALVHGYVQAHGGKLDFDSVKGEGTTVHVTLPAARQIKRRNAA